MGCRGYPKSLKDDLEGNTDSTPTSPKSDDILILAVQYLDQVDTRAPGSLLGNVGNQSRFTPRFEAVCTFEDLANVSNHDACIHTMIHGVPSCPFSAALGVTT